MSLKLIYGRAGCGKSYYCLNDIKLKMKQSSSSPLILIVPEQFSLQCEKDLIKTVGDRGAQKAEVLSFRRMAHRVFSEVGGLARKDINPAGKSILIYKIFEKSKDCLKVFSKAIKQKGFVNTFSEIIAELKRYDITPDELKKITDDITENDLLKDKLREISIIYEEYEKMLHEKYTEPDDHLTELYKRLDSSQQFNGVEIWIDEFSGFTPQEYKIIEKLLVKAKRVNVCLCTEYLSTEYYAGNIDIFSPVTNTAKKLIMIAKENSIPIEKPVYIKGDNGCLPRFKESQEIQHLEKYFFSYPYKTYNQRTTDISIFTASNIYSEIEEIARDITRLCMDEGFKYRDIAVVSRNLKAYEKMISAIFKDHNIPCFIDARRDISDNSLVQMVLLVFRIFTGNWSYDSVFRYLKTGLTNIDIEDVDIIENYVLACGIKGKIWYRDEPWEYIPDQNIDLNRINAIREEVIRPILKLRSGIRGRKKVIEMCTALYDFLCDLEIPQYVENCIDELNISGEFERADEYRQVWNAVIDVVDQLVEVAGEETTGIERFAMMLETGFRSQDIALIPPTLDQVLVGSIERSKNHKIKALYIFGVNDGIFPAAITHEGILTDKDRQILDTHGMELAQDSRAQSLQEQYLVYVSLTSASKYLKLSYSSADLQGRAMRPSPIITRIRRIFPKVKETSDIVEKHNCEDPLAKITLPVPTFNHLILALRKEHESTPISPIWKEVYRWYRENPCWEDKCDIIKLGLNYTNLVNPVDRKMVSKLYGTPLFTSVSRMESYFTCPFGYFIRYGLRAQERKTFNFSPPDIGTLVHMVIDRFSNQMKKIGLDWRTLDEEQCSSQVSLIVDKLVEKAPLSVLTRSKSHQFILERLKQIISRTIMVIAQHINMGSFEPIGYELAFGEGEKLPPILLKLPSGEKVYLVGKIDRVDVMSDDQNIYVRIIDYKSGNKSFDLSDIYHGLQLQLITYMDAIINQSKNKEFAFSGDAKDKSLVPGGILYFKVDDPIVKGHKSQSMDEIESNIMKQFKMKGLVLEDVNLIREMDNQIDGSSAIIPARINKDGNLGISSTATEGQFDLLRKHTQKILVEMAEEMFQGNISISPYKKKNVTSCTYCSYLPVCQFDAGIKGNRYRLLYDMKREDVWKAIGGDNDA